MGSIGGRRPLAAIGYHRVVEDFSSSAQTAIPSLLISLKMLKRHLDWLGCRYRFVGLDELDERMIHDGTGVRPAAAITFDDGYGDFYELAFPLLRKKGIPAALFVVADLVGTTRVQTHDALYLLLARRPACLPLPVPSGSDSVPDITGKTPFAAMRLLLETLPHSALKQLIGALTAEDPNSLKGLGKSESVTWEMLGRIHEAGFVIGSHTKTHVLMPNETESRVMAEALTSKALLERRLGAAVNHFAYPSGAYDDVSLKAVAAAGYRFGYTTCRHRSRAYPRLTIPRTLLWERSCLGTNGKFDGAVLSCLAEGAFDLIGGCRQTHMRDRRVVRGVAA